MPIDLVQIRSLAQRKEDENWRFRTFLKGRCKLESEELDEMVFAATQRVWAGIDCTTCANCCHELKPSFSASDIERLAQRFGMEQQQVIERWMEPTEDRDENPWQIRTTPCPFLVDRRCSIYEDRPADCQGYPYLDKPEFRSRLIGMLGRVEVCPIVYEVVEELKDETGFFRRRR